MTPSEAFKRSYTYLVHTLRQEDLRSGFLLSFSGTGRYEKISNFKLHSVGDFKVKPKALNTVLKYVAAFI